MAFSPSQPPGAFPRPRRFTPPVKKEEPGAHRINERIRVPQVRLIGENGEQLGVVPTHEALRMARDRGLDLMEVSPNSNPPVCKILDYGKFKYEKKKKEHEAKKKQTVIKVKEIQLRPQTDQHDLDYKFRAVKDFLEEGDKAKVTVMFRGREVAYADQGYKMLSQLAEMVKDIAVIEATPKLEGKKLIMILAPRPGLPKKVKAGPVKSGENPAAGKKKPNGKAYADEEKESEDS